MNINSTVRQSAPKPLRSVHEPALQETKASSSFSDTFTSVAKTSAGVGIGTAIGYGLGTAAAMGGFGGATVGTITGLATGMMILGPSGNGKGADGLVYPLAGAVIGGIGGAVLGAFGGDHMALVGAAAGGLAMLQVLR